MTFQKNLQPTNIPLNDTTVIDELDVCYRDKSQCEVATTGHIFIVTKEVEDVKETTDEEQQRFKIEFNVCEHVGFSIVSNFCTQMIKSAKFTAKLDSHVIGAVPLTNGEGEMSYRYIGFLGGGESKEFHTPRVMKKLAKSVWKMIEENESLDSVSVHFMETLSRDEITQFLQNLYVAMIKRNQFKGEQDNKKSHFKKLCLLNALECKDFDQIISIGKNLSKGTILACDLGDAPANYCNCITLNQIADEIATKHGYSVKTLNEEQCGNLGMECLCAVASGSLFGAKLIHLVYRSPDFNEETGHQIALVGKGITMDTGGYNLKTQGASISYMKTDMCGGAAVLSAADVLGDLKVKNIEIHFVVPSCENMISRDAYRPGDILKSMKGITVEIGNTDAEGRLVLIDALHHVQNIMKDFAPNLKSKRLVIDIATLTGAQIVALGDNVAAVIANDDDLSKQIQDSFNAHDEQVWPLPLYKPYMEQLDSKVADCNNISSGGKAGTIMGALFISKWIDSKQFGWAHIDIAGPSYCTSASKCTGFGTCGIVELILRLTKDERARK